ERAEAEELVDEHLLERELLAAIEVDLELGQDLGNDRTEFFGELVLVEGRSGLGVDAFEQARKHLLLDPVDRRLEAFGLAVALRAARVLPRREAVHRPPRGDSAVGG